jgi:hypothetical protein
MILLTNEQIKEIEQDFITKAKHSNYKEGTKAYKDAQMAYFQAVIATLNIFKIGIPPAKWQICMATGRDIITTK